MNNLRLLAICVGGMLAFSSARVMADAGVDVTITNPTFSGTGTPDGWSEQPGPKIPASSIAVDPAGGVHIVDADTGNGLGLGQWVPVQAGHKLTVTVESKGTGSLYLDLMFLAKKPNVMAELNKDKLSDKRVSLGKTPDFSPTTFDVVTPAGTGTAFIWFYSPKAGVCDVVLKSVKIVDMGEAAGGETPASAPTAAPTTSTAPAPSTPGKKELPPGMSQPAPPVTAIPATDDIGSPGAPNPTNVPVGSLPKGMIQTVDFETGDVSQSSWVEGRRKFMSTDIVRNGKYAIKIALVHGQKRSEVDTRHVEPSGVFKYGWSIYIPQDFDAQTWFSIVTQWHTYGTGGIDARDGGPPTTITISKDTWSMKILHQGADPGKAASEHFSFGNIDADRGKWTDFTMEVNWQGPTAGGGYLRLYKNGVKVVDYTGTTWFDNKTSGPYFKVGIYRGSVPWRGDEAKSILYFDDLRVGGADATLDDVDPAKHTAAGNKTASK